MTARRIAFGGTLLVVVRLIMRFIDVIAMSVLARTLGPSDFGLVSVAMTLIMIVEAVFELPVNEVLVRQATISAKQLDTAFTLSLLRGLVLSAVIIVLAWPFGRFYEDRRLVALLCVLSVAPFARGLRSPRHVLYHRQMSFWRDMIIDLGGKSAGVAASMVTLVLTHSYWSIVSGTVAYPLSMVALSYMLAPYRVRLSLSAVSSFSGFLGWMSMSQIVNALSWQSDRLLLAKLITNGELGIFSAASDLASIPLTALFGPMQRPLLSAFSRLQTDLPRLINSYRVATTAAVTIGLPLLVGGSFLATPLVRLLLGPQWLAAAPLFQWLALCLIPTLMSTAVAPFAMALGKTQAFAQINLIELGVKLPVLFLGVMEFGLAGAIASRFAAALASSLSAMFVVRRLTGVDIMTQMSWCWRCIASVAVMALILSVSEDPSQAAAGVAYQLMALGTTVVLGASVYSAALWGLWVLSGSPGEGVEHLIAMEIQKWLGKATRIAKPSL